MADALRVTEPQKQRLRRVAGDLLAVYKTLARMRYLDPDWIDQGPHDLGHQVRRFRDAGINDDIIYLYSVLPYVDVQQCPRGVDFYEGGAFVDYRRRDVDLAETRDPLYMENDEFVMKPWTTALSTMGNDGIVLVYCAKTDRVFMTTQSALTSCDPVVTGEAEFETTGNQGGDQDHHDQDVGETESENRDDDDDESPTFWEPENGRDAHTVLQDIKLWYEKLLVLPGGGEESELIWDSPNAIKALYQKHGWPSASFDGDGFLVDLLRTYARTQGPAEDPEERHIAQTRRSVEYLSNEDTRRRMEDYINNAKDVDQEWSERFKLWLFHYRRTQSELRLAFQLGRQGLNNPENPALSKQEALPFWEMERLRQGAEDAQDRISELQDEDQAVQDQDGANNHANGSNGSRRLQLALKQERTDMHLYLRAFNQCREECAARHPGMTFTEATGMTSLNQASASRPADSIAFERKQTVEEIAALEQWAAAEIPAEATRAKNEAAFHIERLKETLE